MNPNSRLMFTIIAGITLAYVAAGAFSWMNVKNLNSNTSFKTQIGTIKL